MIEFACMENFMRRYRSILELRESQMQNEPILPIYGVVQEQGDDFILNIISSMCKKKYSEFPPSSYLLFENKSSLKDQALINQFLDINYLDWDLLEIKGQIGSGKKTLARHVEKYIWEQSMNNQIPILVDIENFHRQKNQNLDYILQQFPYFLNDYQIQELKQYAMNQQLQLVLIINACNSMDDYNQTQKLIHTLYKEWKNCKVIRFIDSHIQSFRQGNSITVVLDQLTDTQIYNYFTLASRKQAHSALLQLYLDLKLDQKEMGDFRKQISFLLIESNYNIDVKQNIFEIISSLKSKTKSQHSLIERVKKKITSFLHFRKIIEKFTDLQLDSFLRTPYSLSLISKFYQTLNDENMNSTKINFFEKFVELYYYQEQLNQNQLKEMNLNYLYINEIMKIYWKTILQTEEKEKYQNQQFTIVQFIKDKSEFHLFLQYQAWAEYLNQMIIAARVQKIYSIENAKIETELNNEQILNYLLEDKDTSLIRDYNVLDPQFKFNYHLLQEIFSERIIDKQTLIYLFLLTQCYLCKQQIFFNLKAVIIICYCPILSKTFERYQGSMIQEFYSPFFSETFEDYQFWKTYECYFPISTETFKNYQICMNQTQQLSYYKTRAEKFKQIPVKFAKKIYSSLNIELQNLNKQNRIKWNQYSGELLDCLNAESLQELKICQNTYVKQWYFKKQMALFIIPQNSAQSSNIKTFTAVTSFGPFVAIPSSKKNRIMLLNIRNSKIMRRLTINYGNATLNYISCLTLSHDCQYLAACQEKILFLWNIQARLIEIKFSFDDSQICACQFLAGTKLLVSNSRFYFFKVDLEKIILSFQTQSYFEKQQSMIQTIDGTKINIPRDLARQIIVKLLQYDEKVLVSIIGLDQIEYIMDSDDFELNLTVEQLRDIAKLRATDRLGQFNMQPLIFEKEKAEFSAKFTCYLIR